MYMRPVVICGPRCVGKEDVVTKLVKKIPTGCTFIPRITTRLNTSRERYTYLPRSGIDLLAAGNQMIDQTDHNGHCYGTWVGAVAKIQQQGLVPLIWAEREGVKQMRAAKMDCRYVFVAPCSMRVLEERIRGYAGLSEAHVKMMMDDAVADISRAFGPGVCDRVISSDDLDAAVQKLGEFVFMPRDEVKGSQWADWEDGLYKPRR